MIRTGFVTHCHVFPKETEARTTPLERNVVHRPQKVLRMCRRFLALPLSSPATAHMGPLNMVPTDLSLKG